MKKYMEQELDIPFWGSYKHHPPNDSFFENLIAISGTSSNEEVFPLFDPKDYIDMVNGHFGDFLRGCQWNFKSRKENPIDTYNYFKYILSRFQHLKGSLFSERDGKIMHIGLPSPLSTESDERHKSVLYMYECINKAINVLEDYVQQSSANKPSTIIDNPHPPPPQKNNGFRIKNHKCLKDAFDQLERKDFIDEATSLFDFEKVFSGRIPDHKITWLKGPGLLSYFIKSLNNKGIEDERKFIWKTTINCFQDKNQNAFTIKQLRFAKKPSNTDDIDSVIDTINEDSYSED